MRFIPYSPDQGYLLPPNVQDVLGGGHLCFFIRRVVDRLDLSAFRQGYGEEGRPPYHPAMMVSVWLYAYALGLTSSRRLEQPDHHQRFEKPGAHLFWVQSGEGELEHEIGRFALRRGKKVEDELPVPQRSGFVRVEEVQPVFEHQKVKPAADKTKSA